MLGGDDLILKAITEARLAASYRFAASQDPACEAGCTKLAEKHRALASAALTEWAANLGRVAQSASAPGRSPPALRREAR